MTFVADLCVPLRVVDRLAAGRVLIVWPHRGAGLPLDVTVTTQEVHLSLSGRLGPGLAVHLDHLIIPAVREFELLMGVQRSRK